MELNVGIHSDTSKWQQMKRNLQKGQNLAVKVGWFDGKKHTSERSQNITLAQIAKWLEEGHMNGGLYPNTWTPPRPFIRIGLMSALKESHWLQKQISFYLPQIIDGRMTWTQFYQKLGPSLQKLLQEVMNAWDTPTNSPLTVALKGFNNPLIESGYLRDNVEWRLGKKE